LIQKFNRHLAAGHPTKRQYGQSEMAVYNQIRIMLMTYCVLVLLQSYAQHQGRLLAVYKCMQLCLDKEVNEEKMKSIDD